MPKCSVQRALKLNYLTTSECREFKWYLLGLKLSYSKWELFKVAWVTLTVQIKLDTVKRQCNFQSRRGYWKGESSDGIQVAHYMQHFNMHYHTHTHTQIIFSFPPTPSQPPNNDDPATQ
jgi:hypothetical protein